MSVAGRASTCQAGRPGHAALPDLHCGGAERRVQAHVLQSGLPVFLQQLGKQFMSRCLTVTHTQSHTHRLDSFPP